VYFSCWETKILKNGITKLPRKSHFSTAESENRNELGMIMILLDKRQRDGTASEII